MSRLDDLEPREREALGRVMIYAWILGFVSGFGVSLVAAAFVWAILT